MTWDKYPQISCEYMMVCIEFAHKAYEFGAWSQLGHQEDNEISSGC